MEITNDGDTAPVGPPTLADLMAALTQAERRLYAANSEVDAARDALAAAYDAVAGYDAIMASTGAVRPATAAIGGWTVDVTILDVDGSTVAEGEVTLIAADDDGQPIVWGSLHDWASSSLHAILDDAPGLARIVEFLAREAIDASGVPRSAEYDG